MSWEGVEFHRDDTVIAGGIEVVVVIEESEVATDTIGREPGWVACQEESHAVTYAVILKTYAVIRLAAQAT